jgi:hypothetical protein
MVHQCALRSLRCLYCEVFAASALPSESSNTVAIAGAAARAAAMPYPLVAAGRIQERLN